MKNCRETSQEGPLAQGEQHGNGGGLRAPCFGRRLRKPRERATARHQRAINEVCILISNKGRKTKKGTAKMKR